MEEIYVILLTLPTRRNGHPGHLPSERAYGTMEVRGRGKAPSNETSERR